MWNNWIDIKDKLPPEGDEVLVFVEGHRGPSWSNNYMLVAYLWHGDFYEERHRSEPVVGVIFWRKLPASPKETI